MLASSERLGKNLIKAGQRPFPGAQAHHIVAENDERAIFGRASLHVGRVDIDSAANGVWLSGPGMPPPPGYPNAHEHLPVHTNDYHFEVSSRLFGAKPSEVIPILDQIRREILAGTFPK
jgi:hypothetical protein